MKINEYINEKLKLSNHQKNIIDDENTLNDKELLNYILHKSSIITKKTINIIESYLETYINNFKNKYYNKIDKGEIETDEILDQICINLTNKKFEEVKNTYGNDIKVIYSSKIINLGIYKWNYYGPDKPYQFIIIIDGKAKTSDVFEIIDK